MPGLYSITTRSTGTVLTASIYNTDHQNHVDNQTTQMTDDYSSNAAEMRLTSDPGESGTESLASSLAGELERLRFAIKDVNDYLGLTKAQWYSTPTGTIPSAKLATVAIAQGGTGQVTAAAALSALGGLDKTVVDAKGDLLVGTANDTVARKAVGSLGDSLMVNSGTSDGLVWAPQGFTLFNGTIRALPSGNAMVIDIRTDANNDPSETDPVYFAIRSTALGSGAYSVSKITSPVSFTISSGSTIGTVSGQPHRIYVIGSDSIGGGNFNLGVWNPWDNTNKSLRKFDDGIPQTGVTEGGAGGADSPHVFYKAAAGSESCRIIGYFESTQATAGTWVTSPSYVTTLYPGMKQTGDIVNSVRAESGAVTTGTTVFVLDDTIPTNVEGNALGALDAVITPQSAINVLEMNAQVSMDTSTSDGNVVLALYEDASAALAVGLMTQNATGIAFMTLIYAKLAGTASATTKKVRYGSSDAGTVTVNGSAGARLFGGVLISSLTVREIFV